jgi:hypothetical protein
MVIDAIVKEDGTLIAKAPKLLWGKRVKIIIREARHTYAQKKQSQWDEISAILSEARTLDIPRRPSDDILTELRTFRESV